MKSKNNYLMSALVVTSVFATACGAGAIRPDRFHASSDNGGDVNGQGTIVKIDRNLLRSECEHAIDTRLSVEEGGWTAPE